jgi:uncharacterized protein (DUF736 family)
MAEYNNENKGVLFKNKDKKSDNHPDYNGSINIEGIDYWLSSWINESKAGDKYMSLSIGEAKEQQPGPNSQSMRGDDFRDDDVPFS